jgi:N-acetyl-anhydromuramyl-L-alanine amidase AmpD
VLAATLAACSGQRIVDRPSANQDDRIRFLVLHFTDENFARSLDLLTHPHPHPVSAHYLVSRAGDDGRAAPTVYRLVDESRRAWHAGASRWQGHTLLNGESIGIEIVYESHCARDPPRAPGASPWDVDAACPYPPFPDDQIDAVIALARGIIARHPDIEPSRVVGHADIQPENKTDPGPRFPWRRLAAAGVGAWYDDADADYYRGKFSARPETAPGDGASRSAGGGPPLQVVQEALAAWGYGVDASGTADLRTREVLSAFQGHFLPEQRSGRADGETVAILFALLARYRPDELAALRERHPGVPLPPHRGSSVTR